MIKVAYYHSDWNYAHGDVVHIINNLHMSNTKGIASDILKAFDVKTIVEGMLEMKSKMNKKLGTYSSHIGYSPTLGQHWEHPYLMLDDYISVCQSCTSLESLDQCQWLYELVWVTF